MSTYGQLKSDIAEYLARADLTSIIPTFIQLAESQIANQVRIIDMIRRQRAAGQDSRYLALPTGYTEMRRLELWPDSDRHYSLIQVTPENLQVLNLRDTSTSSYNRAQRYTVHREIEFDAPVGADAELEMIFYQRYPALASDPDTNTLLQNDYGIYLYGSLLQAEPYLRNDERIPVWGAMYRSSYDSMMAAERRGRVNQGEARVSLSVATP